LKAVLVFVEEYRLAT